MATGSRAAGTLRKRSRYTRSAPWTTPRSSSGVGHRINAWCRALPAVNAWWTEFQSPKSFWVWNRTIRSAAA